jgi:hypothetical protein
MSNLQLNIQKIPFFDYQPIVYLLELKLHDNFLYLFYYQLTHLHEKQYFIIQKQMDSLFNFFTKYIMIATRLTQLFKPHTTIFKWISISNIIYDTIHIHSCPLNSNIYVSRNYIFENIPHLLMNQDKLNYQNYRIRRIPKDRYISFSEK